MDLDNFEFRPITSGLGFDKTTDEKQNKLGSNGKKLKSTQNPNVYKSTQVEDQVPNPTPVSRSLKKMLDSLPPSVDFNEDKQRELKINGLRGPHTETPIYQPIVGQPSHATEFDVTLNDSLSQAFPKEEVNKRFYHQMVTPVQQYKEMSSSFASAMIDAMVVLGLSSLFVVCLVAITQVDIITMLTHSQLSARTLVELCLLYVGVSLFYFMLARGLFGSTLGDWAFDVQLGSEDERSHVMYPFQVIFRTFVIMLTGIFIIPVVSLAFGKDIAYYFSGLKLYSRQY